ncbi:MAG: DMT family transporter [Prevotella sp.]|nr:DMT family transporter [Prevotella sp.]
MTQHNRKILGHLVALLTVIIWGSTFVFTKLLLLNGLSPAHIFTFRFIIAYVLLLAFSMTRKSHRWMADGWKDELLMVALGIAGGSLYFMAENEAMNHTTTTNTSLIVCLCPLFAAAFISFFYKSERLSPTQVLGTVLAALGVIVVVLNGHFVLHLSPLGDSLAFLACLCWAVYSLLMVRANNRYDVVFITRKVFFYGLLSMIPYFAAEPEMPPMWLLMRPEIYLNLLFLGCVASMVCFVIWNWAMKQIGAVTTTNYVYINPLTTIVFAWLLLDEKITVYFLLGTALILVGMYLADRRKG